MFPKQTITSSEMEMVVPSTNILSTYYPLGIVSDVENTAEQYKDPALIELKL